MTKTCNFPGMKQARREGALARLEHQIEVLKNYTMSRWVSVETMRSTIASKEREAATLRERIANVTWFTKKHRAA